MEGTKDEAPPKRRNYIRRKRCFNDSVKMIRNTLNYIANSRKEAMSEAKLQKCSQAYAHNIEAACWIPRYRLSDEEYSRLSSAKTKELCAALIKQWLQPSDLPSDLGKPLELASTRPAATSPPEPKRQKPMPPPVQELHRTYSNEAVITRTPVPLPEIQSISPAPDTKTSSHPFAFEFNSECDLEQLHTPSSAPVTTDLLGEGFGLSTLSLDATDEPFMSDTYNSYNDSPDMMPY